MRPPGSDQNVEIRLILLALLSMFPLKVLQPGPEPGHTIRMHVSPSQITGSMPEHEGCLRKWGFKYLWGKPSPQSKAAALGTAIHAQLERYVKGGTLDTSTEAGRLALPLLRYLPPVEEMQGLEVEGPILPSASRVNQNLDFGFSLAWQGFRDLKYYHQGMWHQVDYKSTGDVNAYALNTDTLSRDPQQSVYAYDMFQRHPEAGTIWSRWLYTQTRGAALTREVAVVVNLEATIHRLRPIWVRGRELTEIKANYIVQQFDVNELTPNLQACSAYGGCPYQTICKKPPGKGFGELIMTQPTLQEIMARAATPTPAPLTVAAQAPWQPPAQPVALTQEPPAPAVRPGVAAAFGQHPSLPPEAFQPAAAAPIPVHVPEAAPEPSPEVDETPAPKRGKGRPAGSVNKTKVPEDSIKLTMHESAFSMFEALDLATRVLCARPDLITTLDPVEFVATFAETLVKRVQRA